MEEININGERNVRAAKEKFKWENSHMDDLAYDGKITSKRNIPSREYRYRLA